VTLSYAFLDTFSIPIELDTTFEIATHTIRITAIDDEAKRVEITATEKPLP
jgi:hypothetical protein